MIGQVARIELSKASFKIKPSLLVLLCDQKKIAKSCPKMISLENERFTTPLPKMPKNVGDFGKLSVAKGFEKLPESPIIRPIWSHYRTV